MYAPADSRDLSDPGPPLWEQAAAIFVVIILTQAFIGPVFAPTQEETPILRLIWLPVYAVIAGLIAVRPHVLVRAWPAWLILAVLVLQAFASKWWSIDPGVTQRRVIAMAISSAFSIYLGIAFGGRHLPRMLMISCLIMGVGSVIMALAFPSIGVHQLENAGLWRGLWYEKNQMGLVMSAGAVAAAACLASGDKRRMLPAITLVICAFLVLMTQSKTSLLCLMLVLGGAAGLAVVGRGAATAVLAVWAGVTAAAAFGGMMIFAPDTLFELLGKDPSLTGRTDIWAAVMRQSDKSPTLGFGYAAFWGLQSAPAEWVRANTGWLVPTAHNGWLDLLVQLGWVGVTAMAAVLALATLASIWRFRVEGDGYWAILYLAVFLLQSLSESFLLQQNSLAWVFAALAISRVLGPLPQREPPAERPTPYRSRGPLTHGASPSYG